jgi:hypothetical protein
LIDPGVHGVICTDRAVFGELLQGLKAPAAVRDVEPLAAVFLHDKVLLQAVRLDGGRQFGNAFGFFARKSGDASFVCFE